MKIFLAGIAAAAMLSAQQPQVENARFESRSLAGSMESQLKSWGAGPFWAAWSEQMIPKQQGDMCSWNGNFGHAPEAPVRLEGETTLVVLVRVENSAVDQLRVASLDCRFDGGGLPFHWLTGVPEAESLNWLKTQVSGRQMDSAILAISLHAGAVADRALDDLTASSEPPRVREKAAFWLGMSRGAHGVEVLKRMLASDPDERVREQAVFGLSQSKDPAGLPALIDTAKNDKDPRLRSKALFWLGQKAADKQSRDAVAGAVENDPDRSVKEQAVFALSQLPGSEGVPLLINVAKNNPDPQVKKRAMFWLGQSKDPRALDFLTQVLK